MSQGHVIPADMKPPIQPWSLWISPSSRRVKSLGIDFSGQENVNGWRWGVGGSLVSCLPVFSGLSVRTSEHSLKQETGTKCQVDRSGFPRYSQIRLCGGKICTWWPWKPVFTRAPAYRSDTLTKERSEPGLTCNGF